MSGFFARIAISIAALLVMIVAAFIAVGFFSYALYLFLAGLMSPALAAAVTGVAILLIALCLVFATMPRRAKRGRDNEVSREARESAAKLGGELGRRLTGLAEAHTTGSLLAALVAGFAVGVSPKLREFLQDILKL